MKAVVNEVNPGRADVSWKIAVGAQEPAVFETIGIRIKVHNLTGRMHTTIRSARAGDFDCLVGNGGEGPFNELLHTGTGALALPAIVRGAVIFDADRDTHQE